MKNVTGLFFLLVVVLSAIIWGCDATAPTSEARIVLDAADHLLEPVAIRSQRCGCLVSTLVHSRDRDTIMIDVPDTLTWRWVTGGGSVRYGAVVVVRDTTVAVP